jgi:UDP-N-acetyl-alpha-D-muramoyl-L-alanyl-L-glutamate epimerase
MPVSMNKINNFIKYSELIKEYPVFTYENFSYELKKENLKITYSFNISDKHFFYPELIVPNREFFINDNLAREKLENIIFNIGLIELISYWKLTCSPKLIIKPFSLSGEQINWWKKQYFYGLGEFFYLNSIKTNFDDFVNIEVQSEKHLSIEDLKLKDSTIIPLGGGKDSIVTLNLLKESQEYIRCMIVNPRPATVKTAEIAGITEKELIIIKREIHPYLLQLNATGYLNGHTPFSALLAFLSVLISAITGMKNVALSNESSANEPTVIDGYVNHQYSKSFEFESDFRYYVNKYIIKDYNYYSFLRPLNELQIANLFSYYYQYSDIFKSCNAGSKTDSWCCNCPKCLFTYIILSPFISEGTLTEIFGKNLFDSKELLPVFNELVGSAENKPFDCIGTVEEINAALCMTISEMDKNNLPFLLKYFVDSEKYMNCKGFYRNKFLKNFEHNNYLKPEHIKLLKSKLKIEN